MDEALLQAVRNWLLTAKADLESAEKLAEPPNPILETAVYHCQQSAEKAIKGFLTLKAQRF